MHVKGKPVPEQIGDGRRATAHQCSDVLGSSVECLIFLSFFSSFPWNGQLRGVLRECRLTGEKIRRKFKA